MNRMPSLLPMPRELKFTDGSLPLEDKKVIQIIGSESKKILLGTDRLRKALSDTAGLDWGSVVGDAISREKIGISLHLNPEFILDPQGYELVIDRESIRVEARDEAGLFYGICTLAQILKTTPDIKKTGLPCLRIRDWPDFPARGVMLDISRDKVPTMQTVLELVDQLSGWKINQFQLYTEHTFAYSNHSEVWVKASPFTADEIQQLDAFCKERFVELVPNQNSFGHMNRWLTLPRYRPLAECPDGYVTPWGSHSIEPFSLCPSDPGSLALIRELYDELLPNFTSRMFNVGCDETWDLGQGRSKDECERLGSGRVYLEFLKNIHAEVCARGHQMQFWGDIIIQHPEMVKELPGDVIALEWGYEASHPFGEHGKQFADSGLQFYVCPGTSSWNSIAGRTENALGNLQSAAEEGKKHNASGYLITDWGDNGHWQTLPVSYLGYAIGAACAWSIDSNKDVDVPSVVSLHAFDDPGGNFGKLAYDLGNVYKAIGFEPMNESTLFNFLRMPMQELQGFKDSLPLENFNKTLSSIEAAASLIPKTASARPDAILIQQEFDLAVRMLRHACWRALLAIGAPIKKAPELKADLQEVLSLYPQIWRQRNRPGGLPDSLARLETLLKDY